MSDGRQDHRQQPLSSVNSAKISPTKQAEPDARDSAAAGRPCRWSSRPVIRSTRLRSVPTIMQLLDRELLVGEEVDGLLGGGVVVVHRQRLRELRASSGLAVGTGRHAHDRVCRIAPRALSGVATATPTTLSAVPRFVVDVMPKPEILDPQGKAVLGALPRLGFEGVTDVRQGKRFELEVDGERRPTSCSPRCARWPRRCSPTRSSRTSRCTSSRAGDAGVKVGVVTFPGSLDDVDAARAARLGGHEAVALWHGDHDLRGRRRGRAARRLLVRRLPALRRDLPLRAGDDRGRSTRPGGLPVLGICNGFQILCESHLLPGALIRNDHRKFGCLDQRLRIENAAPPGPRRTPTGASHHRPQERRGRLRRRRAHARPARGRGPGGRPLPRDNPNGSHARHRRHHQRARQRRRPDAAPRARRRGPHRPGHRRARLLHQPPAAAARREPAPVFRRVAVAEAVTWALLLAGMFLKYVTETTELGVRDPSAWSHGVVFIAYCLTTVLVAVDQQLVTGRLRRARPSVPRGATVAFERCDRLGRRGSTSSRPGSPRTGGTGRSTLSRASPAGCCRNARARRAARPEPDGGVTCGSPARRCQAGAARCRSCRPAGALTAGTESARVPGPGGARPSDGSRRLVGEGGSCPIAPSAAVSSCAER